MEARTRFRFHLPWWNWICLALTVAIPLSFLLGLLGAELSSYHLWATSGVLCTLLMFVGALHGSIVLVGEIVWGDRSALLWPMLLLATSLLPLAVILTGGALLGF